MDGATIALRVFFPRHVCKVFGFDAYVIVGKGSRPILRSMERTPKIRLMVIFLRFLSSWPM
jgi:hypothetical protein